MANKTKYSLDTGPIALAIMVAAILFSSAFYFAPAKAQAQLLPSDNSFNQLQHTISVSADSSQEVAPDKVEITFSVVSRGPDSSLLQTENDAKLRQIKEKMIALGVPEANIKTVGYSLDRWSEYNKTQEQYVDLGYQLQNTLRVVSYDTSKAGNIVKDAVQNGANDVSGIQFSLSDAAQKELYGTLLKKAVSEAKAKATSMASSAGVSIVSLGQMSEGYSYVAPMANYAYKGVADSAAGSAPEVSISAGLVKVTASVSASYEVSG
ncbi:MAG: SIMPL domain-containing protein [Candidatus Micrarchaeota archaeon]|nr:SIMPL domain-containing protein [Candidatus Micrarchaeota archaeon]